MTSHGNNCQPDATEMALDIHNANEKKNEKTPTIRNGLIYRVIRHFEDIYIFSLMYMNKSPLQPLIGPTSVAREDYSLAHACYLVIWLFLPIAYLIISMPIIKSYVVQDVSLCNYVNDTSTRKCEQLVVTLFTNRFSFAIGVFYILMASFLSISCKRSEHIRASLQSGFWIPKLMLIFVVSLITSSFPPGLFDTVWHYTLDLFTISQTIFIMFLILDISSDISTTLQRDLKNKRFHTAHLLYYGSIAVLFIFSLGMTTYCITRTFRYFEWIDICFVIFQSILLLGAGIASVVKFRRLVDLFLTSSYVIWRTGLTIEYHIAIMGNRNHIDLYTIVDSIMKLFIISYGLFRPYRPSYYTFFNRVLFAYTSTMHPIGQNVTDITQSPTLNSTAKADGILCKEKHNLDLRKKEMFKTENEFLGRNLLTDIERYEPYCELPKSDIELEDAIKGYSNSISNTVSDTSDTISNKTLNSDSNTRSNKAANTANHSMPNEASNEATDAVSSRGVRIPLNTISVKENNIISNNPDVNTAKDAILNTATNAMANSMSNIKSNSASNAKQEHCFSYQHSFIHLVLFQSLLDLNANLTKFQVISESENKFEILGSMFTCTLHGFISILAVVIYWSAENAMKANEGRANLSATNLIWSVKESIVAVMVKAPPFARKPHQIKYIYAGILTCFVAIACATINPMVKSRLSEYSVFCLFHTGHGKCSSTDPSLVALFRVSISATVYFVVLSILLLRVDTTTNFRNKLQIGFWPSKLLFIALIFVISLLIPVQVGYIWIYMSLAATLLIIILQTVCILDAASQILVCVREPDQPRTTKRIFFSCSSIAVLLYTLAITAFFCFYVYFAQFSGCRANRLFIFINLGLCVTACMISLHPVVQEGGLVKSAIITSFCMYCTWSALYNNPREDCNPLAAEMLETELRPAKSVLFILDTAAFFATFVYATINIARIQSFFERFTLVCCRLQYFTPEQNKSQKSMDYPSNISFEKVLFGRSLWTKSALEYEAVNTEGKQDIAETIPPENKPNTALSAEPTEDDEIIPYSYSLLHLIYALLMLYFSLLLITWIDERPGSHMKVNVHWAVMCIRMMASCCSVLVYMWNLVAHLILHSLNNVDNEAY